MELAVLSVEFDLNSKVIVEIEFFLALKCDIDSLKMDPALLRERDAFKKRAMALPT